MSAPPGPAPDLRLDGASAQAVLTAFLRDRVARTGARGLLLALGEGPGPAVAGALAVAAVGAARVEAFLPVDIPGVPTAAAEAVAARLGLEPARLELGALLAGWPEEDLAEEVRPALAGRLAAFVLAQRARRDGRLAVSAADKSELLLGAATVPGEAGNVLLPLGDLYAGQVRRLARYLGLPDRPARTAVAAGWETALLDDAGDEVLHLLWAEGLSPEEVSARGYDPDLVRTVAERERGQRAARRSPLLARVSASAVGLDLELPAG